jgi:hypothetical protein
MSPEKAAEILGVSINATRKEIWNATIAKYDLLFDSFKTAQKPDLSSFLEQRSSLDMASKVLAPWEHPTDTAEEKAIKDELRSLITEKLAKKQPDLDYEVDTFGHLVTLCPNVHVGVMGILFSADPEISVNLGMVTHMDFGAYSGPREDGGNLPDDIAEMAVEWICDVLAEKIIFWGLPGGAAGGSFRRSDADPLSGLSSQAEVHTWSQFLGHGKNPAAHSASDAVRAALKLKPADE